MAKGRTRRTTKRAAPDWAPRLLARLAETANVRAACLAAGVGRSTFYERRDADPEFAAAAAAALDDAVDDLELEARRRASEGVRRVKFHQGQPIMVPALGPDGVQLTGGDGKPVTVPYTEHEYSDVLMIFLLKAHRPDKYRDRQEVRHAGSVGLEHSGEIGGASVEDHVRAAAAAVERLGLAHRRGDDPGATGGGDPPGGGEAAADGRVRLDADAADGEGGA